MSTKAITSSGQGLNLTIGIAYACSFPALIIVLLVCKILLMKTSKCLESSRTAYPRIDALVCWIKREMMYAPIIRQRRARQTTLLHGKLNFGALLDRMQIIFILQVLGINIFLLEWQQPFSSSTREILDSHSARLGALIIANFIPIVITSSIRNPVIFLLGTSYDSLLCIHRWISRMVVLEIIAHGLCHVFADADSMGWEEVQYQFTSIDFFKSGLTGAVMFTVVLLASVKPVRSLAYEIFHYMHIILIIAAFIAVWMHLSEYPQRWFLLTAVLLWAIIRLSGLLVLIYRSWGAKSCVATVERLPDDAVKVALQLSRPWHFLPGQSLYLAIPGVDKSGMHPFSIAWSDLAADATSPSLDTNDKIDRRKSQIMPTSSASSQTEKADDLHRHTMYCIIKKHSGMTRKLYEHAQDASNGSNHDAIRHRALVVGPYSIPKDITNYQKVLLFAGGVGITHQLPYIRQFLNKRIDGQQAPAHVRLVWAVPSIVALEWIRPWAEEIEDLQRKTAQGLTLDLHITKPNSKRLPLKDGPFYVYPGRPDVASTIALFAIRSPVGRSCVSVCAGGSLSDCVRDGVRKELGNGHNMDFDEQGFGW